MFNFRAPWPCFISILGHIDIFQKNSMYHLTYKDCKNSAMCSSTPSIQRLQKSYHVFHNTIDTKIAKILSSVPQHHRYKDCKNTVKCSSTAQIQRLQKFCQVFLNRTVIKIAKILSRAPSIRQL
jgi:hypothetical protein